MSWLSHILFTCKDMSRLISDAMDQSLPWQTRLRMRAHLQICALCRQYRQQLTLLRKVLRKRNPMLHDDAGNDPPSLSAEAKARIQRALDSHRT